MDKTAKRFIIICVSVAIYFLIAPSIIKLIGKLIGGNSVTVTPFASPSVDPWLTPVPPTTETSDDPTYTPIPPPTTPIPTDTSIPTEAPTLTNTPTPTDTPALTDTPTPPPRYVEAQPAPTPLVIGPTPIRIPWWGPEVQPCNLVFDPTVTLSIPCIYHVKKGDSYASIAREFYGRSEEQRFWNIRELNRNDDGTYQKLFYNTTTLFIPAFDGDIVIRFASCPNQWAGISHLPLPCIHSVGRYQTWDEISILYFGDPSQTQRIKDNNLTEWDEPKSLDEDAWIIIPDRPSR